VVTERGRGVGMSLYPSLLKKKEKEGEGSREKGEGKSVHLSKVPVNVPHSFTEGGVKGG